jgi:predicted TPR repeat methyltransferase
LYDRLSVADAREFLRGDARTWDVIAALDMLNYVGDLTEIFAAAAGGLRRGGLMAGTVEKGGAGVMLTAKRRFVHGADHLRAALAAAGLVLADLAEADLRTEGGNPVAGLIFVARREE